MAGHRPYKALRDLKSPERQAENSVATADMLQEMALKELRVARELTQKDVADTRNIGQPSVAKLEQRADIYVSNLRRYIEAVGGTLEITAHFPDGSIKINNFSDLKK